ncbi:hypothetical protein [Archangium sp.]|uniref:hypothetical protein n=1 Tax=Archangium sp. TaxID=1872627 RepID=UPI00389A2F6D
MEWLEFGRLSPEVQQLLAYQAARLSATARPTAVSTPSRENTRARLEALLRQTPASNPWGHPVAEC